jgi:hypothetical protein
VAQTVHTSLALSLIAGASLLLVFIGIHNAWDTITYVATDVPKESEAQGHEPKRPPRPPG